MQLDQLLLKSFARAASVTPNDGADLARPAYGLYVGTSGDVRVTLIGGDTITFSSVPVGIFDIAVKRVFSTGTTASSIIALYYN
jgi:hypothetical protein